MTRVPQWDKRGMLSDEKREGAGSACLLTLLFSSSLGLEIVWC